MQSSETLTPERTAKRRQSGALSILRPAEEVADAMPPARDRTAVPNWVMPILATIVLALIAFVYSTIDREMGRLDRRLETQEIYMKNTREQLIAHGWQVDNQGNITAPPKKEGNNDARSAR